MCLVLHPKVLSPFLYLEVLGLETQSMQPLTLEFWGDGGALPWSLWIYVGHYEMVPEVDFQANIPWQDHPIYYLILDTLIFNMQGHFPYRFQPPSTQFYTKIVQRMSPRKMGQSKASSSLGEGGWLRFRLGSLPIFFLFSFSIRRWVWEYNLK